MTLLLSLDVDSSGSSLELTKDKSGCHNFKAFYVTFIHSSETVWLNCNCIKCNQMYDMKMSYLYLTPNNFGLELNPVNLTLNFN
jgi:hypothetical protein